MSKEELKQETLKEFIKKSYLSRLEDCLKVDFEDGVKLGAKWQQDNSDNKYSEQDVQNILDGFTNEAPGEYIKTNFIGLLNKE
jgi:hypothetical protein